MSTYEYTDRNGRKLRTSMNARSEVCVQSVGATDAVTVVVPTEEAPAVALAILEAAGYGAGGLNTDVETAHAVLEHYQAKRDEQAEREAEDAKVREWMLAVYPGSSCAAGCDDPISDKVRERYHRSREFFTREDIVPAEIVEPRIVQRGDPEPDRDAKWRDAEGDVWRWNETGWSCRSYRHGWGDIGYHVFPWTEVL